MNFFLNINSDEIQKWKPHKSKIPITFSFAIYTDHWIHPRISFHLRCSTVSWKEMSQEFWVLGTRYATTYLLLLLLSHFNCVWPHRRQPTKLPCPWDSPGKNTGVGCHFLLQCMKVKSESEVAQSCPTLCDPVDCCLPGSSIHGIFQARVLEWGAIAFSI